MSQTFVDLDVRPILRDGGEPFGAIMSAVAALAPDQGLRLYATFKPVPLFQVLGAKGFEAEAREIDDGDWEVTFRRAVAAEAEAPRTVPQPDDPATWPAPLCHLDNRDLDPPEPMVRILAALETLGDGEVLSALLCREPMFLLPELAKRGHRWHGALDADGSTYRILIRAAAPAGAASGG